MRNESIRYLIVPGWQGSPDNHWQSHWQRSLPNSVRVEQRDWLTPQRRDWVQALEQAIAAERSPVILIAHSLGCITVAHWAAILDEAGIPNAVINTIDQVFEHPQVRHRKLRRDVAQADGRTLPTVRSPLNFSRTPAIDGPTPALGAHTESVLRAIGKSDGEISRLRARGAI